MFDRAEENKDRLDLLAPGVREEVEREKRAKLTAEEKTAWDEYRAALNKYKEAEKKRKGKAERPLPQPDVDRNLRDRAEARPTEIARRAPKANSQKAMALADQIEKDELAAWDVNRERMKVNFDFWRTRARAEQTRDCLDARRAVHDGDQAFAKGDLIRARPDYEEGIRGWRKVLDDPEFHSLIEDPCLGPDLVDVIRRYQSCLAQDDQDLPESFILKDVVGRWGSRQGSPLPPVVLPKKAEPPPAGGEEGPVAGHDGG